jgi:hypothetical protein
VTDFGADVAFGQVVGKLREHYGIALARLPLFALARGHFCPVLTLSTLLRS